MYDPEYIARFYDDYGEREWERLVVEPARQVSFEVHKRLLDEYAHAGDRVFEAGSGPGRFTIELARIGARILVGDISPEQLRLHREKTVEIDHAIEERVVIDIVDFPGLARANSTRSSATAGQSRTSSKGRTTPSPSCCGSPGPAGTSSSVWDLCSARPVGSCPIFPISLRNTAGMRPSAM